MDGAAAATFDIGIDLPPGLPAFHGITRRAMNVDIVGARIIISN
jgi:hypothetical protein